MELYQLKTFVAVAEEGNLTKAAERIYASQPAVSGHIKALEEELGLLAVRAHPARHAPDRCGQGAEAQGGFSVLLAAEDMVNLAAGYREGTDRDSLSMALNTDTGLPARGRIDRRPCSDVPSQAAAQVPCRAIPGPYPQGRARPARGRGVSPFSDNRYGGGRGTSICKEIPVRVVAPASWSAKVHGLPRGRSWRPCPGCKSETRSARS